MTDVLFDSIARHKPVFPLCLAIVVSCVNIMQYNVNIMQNSIIIIFYYYFFR